MNTTATLNSTPTHSPAELSSRPLPEQSSTPFLYTLKAVLDFCWNNKGKHGFKNWTYEQAAQHIASKHLHGELLFVADAGSICGVLTFKKGSEETGYVYVNNLFCRGTGFERLLRVVKLRFPECRFVGLRSGKFITYDFNRRSYGRRSTNK